MNTPASLDRPGRLALEDGSVFHGTAFGAVNRSIAQAAEVVFNTAMSGYQEALTDPSYWGQILVMTAPLIGNTGVNEEDVESVKVQASGFVVRELSRVVSSFRATTDLSDYLAKNGVLGLDGVDTRALTRRLRVRGVMNGIITDIPETQLSDAQLVAAAQNAPNMNGANLVPNVGCNSPLKWSETLGEWSDRLNRDTPLQSRESRRFKVLALDCGAKRNILRNLADRGCDVEVVPHDISAADIKRRFESGQADGLFISNGPGDPAAVDATIRTLRDVVGGSGKGIPTFGICLGHQLLSLALGAETYKLKFGHRGLNQPVLNLITGRVEITSQNHGFAVNPESLKKVGAEVTHINLNDHTVAGFAHPDRLMFAVQHHPEASPGPHDAGYLFDAFVQMMTDRKPLGLVGLRERVGAIGPVSVR
ncbi:MAG: glutamine-hydrolyzing carbamoyl-phosphate synthase small subunit [Phycisphaerales bacterium]|nr:glutamine-hydrolyzing carbamoyl-phosphate synthase small subunit [Phycisphaerales bacterium]